MITIAHFPLHASMMILHPKFCDRLNQYLLSLVGDLCFFPVQMICFKSQDLKGTELLYLHACISSDKWDYSSGTGYYEDNISQFCLNISLPVFSVFPGVLWLCIVAESLYLTLLFTGGALMTLEQCPCFSVMNKLKLSAFAALCTALSGNTAKKPLVCPVYHYHILIIVSYPQVLTAEILCVDVYFQEMCKVQEPSMT